MYIYIYIYNNPRAGGGGGLVPDALRAPGDAPCGLAYIHSYVYMYIHIHIYIYVERERDVCIGDAARWTTEQGCYWERRSAKGLAIRCIPVKR